MRMEMELSNPTFIMHLSASLLASSTPAIEPHTRASKCSMESLVRFTLC